MALTEQRVCLNKLLSCLSVVNIEMFCCNLPGHACLGVSVVRVIVAPHTNTLGMGNVLYDAAPNGACDEG